MRMNLRNSLFKDFGIILRDPAVFQVTKCNFFLKNVKEFWMLLEFYFWKYLERSFELLVFFSWSLKDLEGFWSFVCQRIGNNWKKKDFAMSFSKECEGTWKDLGDPWYFVFGRVGKNLRIPRCIFLKNVKEIYCFVFERIYKILKKTVWKSFWMAPSDSLFKECEGILINPGDVFLN